MVNHLIGGLPENILNNQLHLDNSDCSALLIDSDFYSMSNTVSIRNLLKTLNNQNSLWFATIIYDVSGLPENILNNCSEPQRILIVQGFEEISD
jgi:hypothetical protein